VQIGADRQLFVDDFWIDTSAGVTRKLHEPVNRGAAISPENPWETYGVSYMVTFRDGDRFRGWYRCDGEMPGKGKRKPLIAYAESGDGIHWEKPELGLIDYKGSKQNNLVWIGPGTNMAPFLDDGSGVPENERYKAIVRDKVGLHALLSADGLDWRLMQEDPIHTEGLFDSHNIAFRDPWRGEYVIYSRGVDGVGDFEGGVRWIRRSTSEDFRNWTPLVSIDAGEVPNEHLYTNACVPYERAPGTYLMFPSRLVVDRQPSPDWPRAGVNDIVFMSSRDGMHFDRSFKEAFRRPGPDESNWHDRAIYMERGILQTSPTEISMYGMENWWMPTVRISRFTLRTDGFVSVKAGYGGGEFTTRPLVFEGDELELNYATSAVGSLRVEVQTADGTPVPGLTLDECPEIYGDEIEGTISWGESNGLSSLAGQPVRLRFALMDADLYAFRFRHRSKT
jgi:hypothetical protein